MLNIRKFLGLCDHKWEIKEEMNIVNNDFTPIKQRTVYKGKLFVLVCKNCGKLEKKQVTI